MAAGLTNGIVPDFERHRLNLVAPEYSDRTRAPSAVIDRSIVVVSGGVENGCRQDMVTLTRYRTRAAVGVALSVEA